MHHVDTIFHSTPETNATEEVLPSCRASKVVSQYGCSPSQSAFLGRCASYDGKSAEEVQHDMPVSLPRGFSLHFCLTYVLDSVCSLSITPSETGFRMYKIDSQPSAGDGGAMKNATSAQFLCCGRGACR